MNPYPDHDTGHRSGAEAITSGEKPALSLLYLTILALLLGIVTGLGAVLFRDLISLLHNLFFAGTLSLSYDANVFTAPSRWGVFIILAPVIGAVIVTFLVSNFAPEAKGHGVPEVMDAIYYREGVIRPVVALVKSLASAFAIGSGSSVGPRRPDYSNRFRLGLDIGSGDSHAAGAADRAGSGRRWSWHRRDIQYADRRCNVRHRTDVA